MRFFAIVLLLLLPLSGQAQAQVLAQAQAQAQAQTPSPSPNLEKIETLIKDGWYEEADQLLATPLQARNPDPLAYFLKSRTTMFVDLKEAQGWAQKATKAAPEEGRYWTMLGTIKAFRIRQSPLRGATLGRSSKKDFEKGAKLAPTNHTSLWAMLRFYMYAPGIAGGNKDRARELAEDLYRLDPAQGHLARAQLLRHLDKDLPKARVEMELAAAASPHDAQLCYELAGILRTEGHREDALHFYQLGAQRDTVPSAGAEKMGTVYLRRSMLSEARASFEQALAEDPNNLAAIVGLGRVLLAGGQVTKAKEFLRQTLAENPQYAPARYYLAEAMLASKKAAGAPASEPRGSAEAVVLLEEYLAQNLNRRWPSRSRANWRLALALEKEQRFDQAWKAISRAKELPGASDAMEKDFKRLEFLGED